MTSHQRMRRHAATALVGVMLVLAGPAAATSVAATAGDLDTTFAGDGKVTTSFTDADGRANAVAIQADGKVVTAGARVKSGANGIGEMAVVRYNADGTLDQTFSNDGRVVTDFDEDGPGGLSGHDEAFAVAIQGDGKIVVAGATSNFQTKDDFALARYTGDGTLDKTFSGDGKVTTDLSGGSDGIDAMIIEADGDILVAGAAGTDFGLARYHSNGALDDGFSGDGMVMTDFSGRLDRARAMAVQVGNLGAGGIVVVGRSVNGPDDLDVALARYTRNGSLDTNFSIDGRQRTSLIDSDGAWDVAIQPTDAKVVVVGGIAGNFLLLRYTSSGTLDPEFDDDGQVTTDLGGSDAARAVSIDSAGGALNPTVRILVGGTSAGDFALAQYDEAGVLRPAFAGDGTVTTDFDSPVSARAAARAPGNKVVLAGTASNILGASAIAAARYHLVTGTTDTDPPQTTIATGPPPVGKDAEATFTFNSDEAGSTFACSLDGAPFAACTSPHTATGLADGEHSFSVTAIDAAGNTDPSPAVWSFVVDATPPNTTITVGPQGVSNNPRPTFGFSSSEAGSTFACAVDGGAFALCESPYTAAQLADGQHTFAVKATDPVGNTEESPAIRSFMVDTTPPETKIHSGPGQYLREGFARFEFQAMEVDARLQCSVDGGNFHECSSPYALYALSEGPHTFRVRATDRAGNVDPTPAEWAFVADRLAPNTLIDTAPPPTSESATPTFAFHSTEEGSTFECSLDGRPYGVCNSPHTAVALAAGVHDFRVRAIDPAGNPDFSPAEYVFTITAPSGGGTAARQQSVVESTVVNGIEAVRTVGLTRLARGRAVVLRGFEALTGGFLHARLKAHMTAGAGRSATIARVHRRFTAGETAKVRLEITRSGRRLLRRTRRARLTLRLVFTDNAGHVTRVTRKVNLVARP